MDIKCGYIDCSVTNPKFQCSRCRVVRYCCVDHQKASWNSHKAACQNPSSSSRVKSIDQGQDLKDEAKPLAKSEDYCESRECRCMFCGSKMSLKSEEEAVEHMRVCPALQEQLQSKEQFTIPAIIQEKVNMTSN